MNDARSIQRSQFQPGLLSNRWLLMVSILLGHVCLLGMLMLLPQEEQHEAKPLPMMMVDLQPPVPLVVGAHSNSSRQAVTSQSSMATLTQQESEGERHDVPSKQTIPLKSPVMPETAKPVSRVPVSQATHSMLAPDKIASNVTASEHALTTQQAATIETGLHNDTGSKRGTAMASTSAASGLSGVTASSPKFGAGYLSNPAPDYPALAREMGEEGKVLLHVLVTPEGRAKKVKLHHTSGSDSLDDAALRAVRKWRFVPAKLGEQAVEAWVYVPITFKLD